MLHFFIVNFFPQKQNVKTGDVAIEDFIITTCDVQLYEKRGGGEQKILMIMHNFN